MFTETLKVKINIIIINNVIIIIIVITIVIVIVLLLYSGAADKTKGSPLEVGW